ncbi:MAG: response regulator [wastewater metagenome]|nr:response regulator [Candidatus Loosdrechtia aerotolerans]
MERAVLMIGTLQDITEQKYAGEEARLLQAITMAITEAEDFHSALDFVLRTVCQSAGWIYGEAWIPSPDGKYLEYSAAWHKNTTELEKIKEESKKIIFPLGSGLPGRVWSTKEPEWRQDAIADKDSPHRASLTVDSNLKTAVGIPVTANNVVVAVCIFFMQGQQQEDKRLVNLISSVAARVGTAIRRKQVEESLHENEKRLQSFLDNAPALVYIKDILGRYIFVNKQFERMLHKKKEEIQGKTDYDLFPREIADSFSINDRKVLESKTAAEFDEVLLHNDEPHTYLSVKFPLFDSTGAMYAICDTSTDVTRRKHTEEEKIKVREQLYHIQRMEYIGKFAGSIAHDFNNILSAIIGYAEMLQNKMKKNHPLRNYVQKILESADRAAKLTQNLLTLSRKQISNPKPINLNTIIQWIENTLLRLIPRERIQLKIVFIDKHCTVMADYGQIEQVLVNLVTNARDAMPDGGILTICTEIVELDQTFIREYGYGKAGKYVCMIVSDTGTGMDEETKKMIFEPFFTTKKKGTGLGLAVVYGIIKQHGGYIQVKSAPGEGTTFKIYLPLIRHKEKEKEGIFTNVSIPKAGTETILLVEDETDVREIIKAILNDSGYRVIDAIDGEDALHKFLNNQHDIHLLILDVMMPKKNGKELYDEIKKMKSDIKTLFMSGYSQDVITNTMVLEEKLHFIPKPLSTDVMLTRIREILDTPVTPP